MKKLLIIIAALLLCCGCSEKKHDDISEEVTTAAGTENTEDISETVETPTTVETSDTDDTVIETGFREYNESDFNKINVSLSYPDKASPVGLECIHIPEYDFGERLAPCKNSDEMWKYYGGMPQDYTDMESDSIMNNPEKGIVKKAYKRDNVVYMIVSYDDICYYCHEWSVFRYDILTKKMEKVYTNISELDEDCLQLQSVFIVGKKLVKPYYIFNDEDNTSVFHIEVTDLENGTSEEIYTSEEDNVTVYSNGSNKLALSIYRYTTDSTMVRNAISSIMEYDIETGEKRYLTEENPNDLSDVCVSDISGYIERDNKANKWNLVTENYRINTDMVGAKIIYLSDKKVIMKETAIDRFHTFDLENMEHYVTKIDGVSDMECSFDGNIIMSDGFSYGIPGDLYYIIPELGVAYKFAEEQKLCEINRCGNSAEFYEIKNDNPQEEGILQINGNKAVSACIIKSIEE